VEWDHLDPSALFEAIRQRGPAADAERTVLAFERALDLARIDGDLLEHLLVACTCLLAHGREQTPRTILEHVFRRSVTDAEWRVRYQPLFG
jgi:hypothetical protein